VTDNLKYIWDCTYNIEFPAAVEDLDVNKLRTIAQEVLGFNEIA